MVNGSTIKVWYGGGGSGGAIFVGGFNDDRPPATAPLLPLSPSWIEVEGDVCACMSKLRQEVRRLCGKLEGQG
jgi:hypothetical protein